MHIHIWKPLIVLKIFLCKYECTRSFPNLHPAGPQHPLKCSQVLHLVQVLSEVRCFWNSGVLMNNLTYVVASPSPTEHFHATKHCCHATKPTDHTVAPQPPEGPDVQ